MALTAAWGTWDRSRSAPGLEAGPASPTASGWRGTAAWGVAMPPAQVAVVEAGRPERAPAPGCAALPASVPPPPHRRRAAGALGPAPAWLRATPSGRRKMPAPPRAFDRWLAVLAS